MKRLTLTELSGLIPDGDISAVSEVDLRDKGIEECEDLSSCKALKKLEMPGNRLTSLEPFQMNLELCWLDVSKNLISTIDHLKELSSLAVLKLSHNQIRVMEHLDGLSSLKALVLDNNQIVKVGGLAKLKKLETLILSHNLIEEFPVPKRPFENLTKLSLSHNRLKAFPFGDKFGQLTELRLNGNKLTMIPESVKFMARLSILDVGKNAIPKLESLEAMSVLRHLTNLNVAGNPFYDDVAKQQAFHDFLPRMASRLKILNSKPIQKAISTAQLSKKGKKRQRQTAQAPAALHNEPPPAKAAKRHVPERLQVKKEEEPHHKMFTDEDEDDRMPPAVNGPPATPQQLSKAKRTALRPSSIDDPDTGSSGAPVEASCSRPISPGLGKAMHQHKDEPPAAAKAREHVFFDKESDEEGEGKEEEKAAPTRQEVRNEEGKRARVKREEGGSKRNVRVKREANAHQQQPMEGKRRSKKAKHMKGRETDKGGEAVAVGVREEGEGMSVDESGFSREIAAFLQHRQDMFGHDVHGWD
ncbi:unnamed protein product [Vitrella brassicaformis CCMP3155]|uniref:U2A'/phosphoprotein 32 family A C-terminal domain-containing protein n=2 Tax=Vitrella brassicaformis TaxID=1169539 RepID=A0A0G4H3X2_VITBC|nr:unnamed protein product [Vitrella brassicaformis CCMP3155]|mmetsp:Transcript_19189/g.55030  ORF Transcript_19189/g.55030 Transcript_19189/m.55030 type:complete len:528 (+) Transcript_19189:28-1611(+)|eukprot:CEM38373.1 unnamed protein product [Vitrella brassicaformis CCMP3155]